MLSFLLSLSLIIVYSSTQYHPLASIESDLQALNDFPTSVVVSRVRSLVQSDRFSHIAWQLKGIIPLR